MEVVRAVRPHGDDAVTRAHAILERLHLLAVDDALLDAAATLDPCVLRSLDAIHLAAARALGDELDELVTYDVRMSRAASRIGIKSVAPK